MRCATPDSLTVYHLADPLPPFISSIHPRASTVESQPERYILTGCTDLQQIHFQAVSIKRPCDSIPLTLSTVDSRQLNKILLDIACGEVNCQKKFDSDVDLASWQPVDQALCELVEKVGSRSYGVEFEVAVRVEGPKEVMRAVGWSKMFNGLRKKGVVTISQLQRRVWWYFCLVRFRLRRLHLTPLQLGCAVVRYQDTGTLNAR